MPRNSYQYGTSPRKYEPEYTRTTTNTKRTKNPTKQVTRKENKNKVNTKVKEKRETKTEVKKKCSRRKKQSITSCSSFGYIWYATYCKL